MRCSGILLAISSLPSKYGIGDFGKEAYEFVDLVKKAGFKIWQLLPINPIGYGASPYQSVSGEAINTLYISLDSLKEEGYIKSSLKSFNSNKDRVDYLNVEKYKEIYLKEAFKNQNDTKKRSFKEFLKNNSWVKEYAQYLTLSLIHNYDDWWNWPKEERYAHYNNFDFKPYRKSILYYEWLQYIAYKQYFKLKKYANLKGVKIMGDIPFYVGGNSADMWANQDEFLLNQIDAPTDVAGVPPDYFAKTGQRRGNPIYDWDYMKDDNFTFWIKRLGHVSTLFDIIRIDHFRAFDTYWKIPVSCPTAIEGEWCKAYGDELFSLAFEKYPDLDVIAEDLGDLFPSVLELRDKYNLRGMNVIEFTILDPKFEIKEKQVVYSGTHDNDTLKGWYSSLTKKEKARTLSLLNEKKIEGKNTIERLLKYVFSLPCEISIIPMQDILELSSYSRMNVPGVCGSPNWEYKMVNFNRFKNKIEFIKNLNKTYKR